MNPKTLSAESLHWNIKRLHEYLAESFEIDSVGVVFTEPAPEPNNKKRSVTTREDCWIKIDFKEPETPSNQEVSGMICYEWVFTEIPKWQDFMDDMATVNGLLFQVASHPMASVITTRISRLENGTTEWRGELDPLIEAWNSAPPPLTAEQVTGLEAVAERYYIPLVLVDGKLAAKSLTE